MPGVVERVEAVEAVGAACVREVWVVGEGSELLYSRMWFLLFEALNRDRLVKFVEPWSTLLLRSVF